MADTQDQAIYEKTGDVIRILHVDDDSNHLIITKRMIEKLDPIIQVDSTSPQDEVFSKLESYDCIVTDYLMPPLRGIEFLKKVKDKNDIPIILYTGQGSKELAEAFSAGINDYIKKNFELDHYRVLVKRIRIAVERNRVYARLRASERRLRSTLDAMLEGCLIISYGWRFLYVNDAAARQGRKEKEELFGTAFMDAYPGIEKTEVFQVLQRCMEEGKRARMENEFEYLEGDKAWFDLSIEPVPEGIFILSIDITKRKRAEIALRDREEKLRSIFNASPCAITVSDLEGVILECNQVTLDLYGYSSREEVVGRSVLEFIAERDHAGVLESLKLVFVEGSINDVEYIFLTREGREFPTLFSASVLKDASGKPYGFVAVTKDISELKKLLELREYHQSQAERAEKEM
jgi:PAS domain S-box-containing protein